MNRGGLDKCEVTHYTRGVMEKPIEMLDQRRERERLNHTQFAAKLGISREYWASLRSGKARVGRGVWERAIEEWPELGYIPVSLFLLRGGSK